MNNYKKYICTICGFIYDEELGLPEEGISPGTLWSDIPENWLCTDCRASKENFEIIEE